MTHDDLCPTPDVDVVIACAYCDLIARVREDERSLHADDLREYGARGERNGYAAALRDAVEAVKALPYVRPAYYGKGVLIHGAEPDFVRSDAVAAIEALGGER